MQHTKSDKQVLAKFKQSHFPTVIEFLNSSNKGEEATNHLESLEIPSLIASLKKIQKRFIRTTAKNSIYSNTTKLHCTRIAKDWWKVGYSTKTQ